MILVHTNTRRSRRAFTLLEMVVVMWAMGLITLLGVALMLTMLKTSTMGEAIGEWLSRRAELARQFREHIARAEAAPEQSGAVRVGSTTLILTMPGGSTVIYYREPKMMVRLERTGKTESIRNLPLDRPDTKTEFLRPTGGSGVFTLRLTETNGSGPVRASEFSAVLGGNLR
jgi:type II secretory pathway pseudopilin PulG